MHVYYPNVKKSPNSPMFIAFTVDISSRQSRNIWHIIQNDIFLRDSAPVKSTLLL